MEHALRDALPKTCDSIDFLGKLNPRIAEVSGPDFCIMHGQEALRAGATNAQVSQMKLLLHEELLAVRQA